MKNTYLVYDYVCFVTKSRSYKKIFAVILFTISGYVLLLNNNNFDIITSSKTNTVICQQFVQSNSTIINSNIAIIIVVINETNYDDYQMSIDTIECYAKHFGYQFHQIIVEKNKDIERECKQKDMYFKRHCALTWYLEANKDTIEYALYLDADMGVINPCHKIQEYIDEDTTIEITFYERYYNHEIAAGSYLLKNTKFVRNFLLHWSNYEAKLPKSFHGTDNGALHQLLMEFHFTDDNSKRQCYELWKNSKDWNELFEFEACTKNALFSNGTLFVNNKVKIIRKMSPGWVRDGWLTKTKWGPQDFMFHGWKKSKLGWEWNWPFVNEFDLSKCKYQDSKFSNFQFKNNFSSTKEEINGMLERKSSEVHENYKNILYKLNLKFKLL